MMSVRRWRSGSRVMSPSRSTSTGLRVFSTGSRYCPAPSWPEGIRCSSGGSGAPSERGCVGRQSTYFSPISACGRIVQLASARKFLKAGVFDLQYDRRLLLRCGRHRADRPDLDAIDLDLLAGDHVGGVVEDRPDRVAAARAARRGGEQHDRAATATQSTAANPAARPLHLTVCVFNPTTLAVPERPGRPHRFDEVARPALLRGV